MKDWFHDILNFLFKDNHFDGIAVELNAFLIKNLNIDEENIIQAKQLKKILDHLVKNEFISWGYKPHIIGLEFASDGVMNLDKEIRYTGTLKYHTLSANLTLKGHQYISEREWQIELHKSQIETNASTKTLNETVLPNNFDSQEKFSTRSLILAALSGAFILATIILTILDKTPQRLQDIEKAMRNQDTTLKSIQLSLKEINSSIQTEKTDTVFVKMK